MNILGVYCYAELIALAVQINENYSLLLWICAWSVCAYVCARPAQPSRKWCSQGSALITILLGAPSQGRAKRGAKMVIAPGSKHEGAPNLYYHFPLLLFFQIYIDINILGFFVKKHIFSKKDVTIFLESKRSNTLIFHMCFSDSLSQNISGMFLYIF